jgi:hypothetical protein
MTTKELIEMLLLCDPDATVAVAIDDADDERDTMPLNGNCGYDRNTKILLLYFKNETIEIQ